MLKLNNSHSGLKRWTSEEADVRSLVAALAQPILLGNKRRCEYTFREVVNVAHQNELFNWMLHGKETQAGEAGILVRKDFVLRSDSNSKFGKLLKRYAPRAGDFRGPRYRPFRFGKPGQLD